MKPTTMVMSQLRLFLSGQCLFEESERLVRRALEIDERTLGPNHHFVAVRLNNLANLLRVTGRLSEAEPLLRRSLDIDERCFGPDHPEVAVRLNNLGQVLEIQNR